MIQFSMRTRKNLPYEGSGIRNHHRLKTDRQSNEDAGDHPGQRPCSERKAVRMSDRAIRITSLNNGTEAGTKNSES
jgi:hypothetical protein